MMESIKGFVMENVFTIGLGIFVISSMLYLSYIR